MKVHVPTGPRGADAKPLRLHLDSIEGKVIGLIDNSMPNSNSLFEDIEALLLSDYGVTRVINHRMQPGAEAAEAAMNKLTSECDAIIVGMANSGAPTSWCVRDCVRAARKSVPVVCLGTDEFQGMVRSVSQAMGHADLPSVAVHHPFTKETRDDVRQLAPGVTEALVRTIEERPEPGAALQGTTEETLIEVPDDIEGFNRVFMEKGWGDGLPLVPPTPERVARMLRHTRRDPAEVIASIPPYGTATVESVAAVAVMSGCLPEYLPVMLAATEAIADKQFELFFLQNTIHPTTTWLVINGPAIERLKVNGGVNCFGPGNWANATMGRALRLITLAIGGGRPGEIDMATQGQPGKFLMCCAENEAESPWEPLHVERGFDAGVSTVTVIAAKSMVSFTTHTQDTNDFIRVIGNAMTGVTGSEYRAGGAPTLVLSPEHAQLMARGGLSKADLKRKVWETALLPVSRMGVKDRARTQIDRRDELGEFTDATMLTPAKRPEDIVVLVAGGWGMLSSYIPCHAPISWPITREIDDWVPDRA